VVNFFLSKVKGYFRFFNLDFLGIILWGQGCSGLSIIEKQKSGWRVWRLLVAIGSLLRRCLKHRVILYIVGRHVLASMERRSFDDNVFPSPSFLSTSKGVLTLQSCKMVLNYLIVLNLIYLFINFIIRHLIFYVFYQIWSSLLWFLFILLLIFFYWILFFNLIPNHLIVFFFNLIIILIIAILFILSSLLDYFFYNFIPYCLISLNFLIYLVFIFFYHAFKTCPYSQSPSCPRLGRITGVTRVNQFFYYKESKNDIILIKK